jgi:phospholipid N-methyltransferase
MNSGHITILSLVCIVAGSVLTAVSESQTIPLMLIGAGTAVLTKAIMANQAQTVIVQKEVRKALSKAEEAFEQTATIRRDLIKPPEKP